MIPKHRPKRSLLLYTLGIFLLLVVGIAISLITYIIQEEQALANRIYPGVYIENYSVARLTKSEALNALAQTHGPIQNINITINYHNEPIATLSASRIGLGYNDREVVDRAYLIGRVANMSSRIYQKFATHLGISKFYFGTQLSYDTEYVQDFLTGKRQIYEKPAKNALFTFENGKVSEFKREETGLALDTETFAQQLDQQIKNLKTNPHNVSLTLTDHVIQPEITLAKANQFGVEEEIGVGRSDYTHSSNERVHNVILGATKINGILVPKGEEFSFDSVIGDIDAAHGFIQAYVIQSGKTVLGDGGGICQVSTTMFRAAMNAGLPVTERHAHAYRVGYYENDAKPGLDATIYSPTVDFKFKNDTPGAILIQTEINEESRLLTFHLYGKKDGRRSEVTDPILTDVAPPPPALNQDDPTLPRGVTKQVDFPAWGGKSVFSYKIIYADATVKDQTFVSVYKPWQAVYLVGTKDG